MFKKDLPKDFKELSIPLKVGVTNSKKADFLLFNTGRIDKALTASMAIP
jgi:predicted acylesterase/phospholipase RssA